MGTIDVIILVIIGIGLVRGGIMGLIKQLGSLVGIILGVIGCNIYGGQMTSLMSGWFPSLLEMNYGSTIVSMLSHTLLFVIIYWALTLIALLLRSVTNALALGLFDKILGAVLCAFKYLLALSIILNIWMMLFPSGDAGVNAKLFDGELYNYVYKLASWVMNADIIPDSQIAINSVAI
ncbi:MAG: CvpA family protein [Bacteroidales bacterium]